MLPILALLAPAFAQSVEGGAVPEINAQNFRPSVDAAGTLWVDDSTIQDRAWGARALFHYTLNPLVYEFEDGTRNELVSDIVQADVLASVTVSRLRLGLDLPVYLSQAGSAGSGAGLGDIGIDGKYGILDRKNAAIGLAVDGRVFFPTASVDNALGAANTGWEIAAVVDRGIGERFLLAANVGIRGGPKTELENIALDDFLVTRLAGSYAVSDGAGLALEFAGEKSLSAGLDNLAGYPLEWLLGGYGYVSDNLVLRGGAGTAITSGIGAPELRVVAGLGWEPRAKKAPEPPPAPPADGDGDGIPDASDACPTQPEDKDDVKDADGCAEPEVKVSLKLVNATDGAVIPVGRLIVKTERGDLTGGSERELELVPGTYQVVGSAANFEAATLSFTVGHGSTKVEVKVEPKKDGKIVVTRDKIDLKEKVYFDTGKATIQSRSFGLLDQVAQVMNDYSEIELLRVEGHTDSVGSDTANMDLSQRRADSVKAYLVSKGVSANRLTAKGFGETKPLDPAQNKVAYEKNRRVEVFIERWVDKKEGAEPAKAEPAKAEPAKAEPAKAEEKK